MKRTQHAQSAPSPSETICFVLRRRNYGDFEVWILYFNTYSNYLCIEPFHFYFVSHITIPRISLSDTVMG